MPDLMVAPPDAPGFGNDELQPNGVLLVAEVVSPSSQRQDRVAKLRAYAQGRVPLYLLIDPVADPATVTLFSEPGSGGHGSRASARADGTLQLPPPFPVKLEAKRLLA